MRRKMKNLVIFLMVCFVMFSAKAVNAQIISFGDNSIYWPGWGNNDNDSPWPGRDNDLDTIGVPNFTGGQAVVNDGRLASLTFNSGSGFSPALSPGDLFINLGANQNWDYVVDLTQWTTSGKYNYRDYPALPGDYNIYPINLDLNDTSGYILSGTDNKNGWNGYYIRDNHPVAANISWQSSGGSVYFSGWNSSMSYTFTLPNGGLDLENSGSFIIGWGVNCANDVIYETLNYNPIPEPATLSLLGLGLLGLVGIRRKEKLDA